MREGYASLEHLVPADIPLVSALHVREGMTAFEGQAQDVTGGAVNAVGSPAEQAAAFVAAAGLRIEGL